MSGKLEIARANVGKHMDAILRNFVDGARITVIVRPTVSNEDGSRDFLMTDDNLTEVVALIARRQSATIRRGIAAACSGDVIAMLRAFEDLKGWEE